MQDKSREPRKSKPQSSSSGKDSPEQLLESLSQSLGNLSRDLPKIFGKLDCEQLQELATALRPLSVVAKSLSLDEAQFPEGLRESLLEKGRRHFSSHPWHGVSIGDGAPEIVTCYIEMVPTDTIKYEVDKPSGLLKADRPQLFSNVCPANYGFIPQTYCGDQVAAAAGKSRKGKLVGDGDPLDICVLSSHGIPHGGFLMEAVVVGGFRLIDRKEADDKLVAVMKGDPAYGQFKDLADVPKPILERLKHYFLTYKNMPGEVRKTEIAGIYGAKQAHDVIRRSQEDYANLIADIRAGRK
jgi:inorganic pyrophosphatase